MENTNIYVNESNILDNYNILKTMIGESTTIMAVIKANGYGLGLVEVAKTCEKLGIDVLCVLDIPQAIALRNSGITMPIQLLGTSLEEDFDLLVEHDLIQVIPDLSFAEAMSAYGKKHKVSLKGHVKVNTGLNRLGMDDYNDVKACYELDHVNVLGIYSHFVEAQNGDEDALSFSKLQIERFDAILEQLKEEGIDYGMSHLQNSPSILQFGDLKYDAIRVGMILFGLFHPEQAPQAKALGFKETIRLETHVAQVRTIEAGESIGYGRSYVALEPMKIATIASGYCDGVMKALSLNKGYVYINGVACPIIGDIAMSQFMVDVSHITCKREDKVLLFGDDNQTIYDYLSITKQSINELISHIRYTMPRIYTNEI